jgi:hypothetical protein
MLLIIPLKILIVDKFLTKSDKSTKIFYPKKPKINHIELLNMESIEMIRILMKNNNNQNKIRKKLAIKIKSKA